MSIQPLATAMPLTLNSVLSTQPDDSISNQMQPLEGGPAAPAFGDVIGRFVQQVDTAQHKSDQMVEALALGEPVDVHQVMLATTEASNAMQMALQVRSKVLDAYQEVMRTSI